MTAMTPVPVDVDNFARAETARMFLTLQADAGGVNRFRHNRTPTPVEHQPVIRMNRDTLYSSVVADISEGATVTVPDGGRRYVSLMVVNEGHFINRILHDPGEHELTVADFDSPHVLVGARILVDPADPADVAEVNALQDGLGLRAGSSRPFEPPEYDQESLDANRTALLGLARHVPGFAGAFGRKEDVDPVKHLLGSAAGWGGLPEEEAMYVNVDPGLPVGEYPLTVRDVPVDGFWSISMYNAEGYFEPNDLAAYSLNNLTAERDPDGSITVWFGGGQDRPNRLPLSEGWNYLVRMYRPRPEVRDGGWTFPALVGA